MLKIICLMVILLHSFCSKPQLSFYCDKGGSFIETEFLDLEVSNFKAVVHFFHDEKVDTVEVLRGFKPIWIDCNTFVAAEYAEEKVLLCEFGLGNEGIRRERVTEFPLSDWKRLKSLTIGHFDSSNSYRILFVKDNVIYSVESRSGNTSALLDATNLDFSINSIGFLSKTQSVFMTLETKTQGYLVEYDIHTESIKPIIASPGIKQSPIYVDNNNGKVYYCEDRTYDFELYSFLGYQLFDLMELDINNLMDIPKTISRIKDKMPVWLAGASNGGGCKGITLYYLDLSDSIEVTSGFSKNDLNKLIEERFNQLKMLECD